MFDSLPADRVAPALRFLMVERRMSQDVLAVRAGYTSSAVSRRLNGTTPISLDDLRRFAQALDVDVQISLVESTPHASDRAA